MYGPVRTYILPMLTHSTVEYSFIAIIPRFTLTSHIFHSAGVVDYANCISAEG